MKKTLLIVLILLALYQTPVEAASRPSCTAQNVTTWLIVRKAHLNAAVDVARLTAEETITPLQASILLDELAVNLWVLPRPYCADNAMAWTFYVFTTFSEAYACLEGNMQCFNIAMERAQLYQDVGVEEAIRPLEKMAGYNPSLPLLEQLRPPGWNVFVPTSEGPSA